jgi:hypothetical protein
MNAPATFPRRPLTGWLYLARTLASSRIHRLQPGERHGARPGHGGLRRLNRRSSA